MTELARRKMEDLNKLRPEDSRKGIDSTNTGVSKSNIDRTGSPGAIKRGSKSSAVTKKGKRVCFSKILVDTVIVESYKKYNMDMSYEDSNNKQETIKCKCLIF
jgi:hypothetical protein